MNKAYVCFILFNLINVEYIEGKIT